jgi:hypothetical protein
VSVQAMSWVLEYSESRLAARLVLLSIANHAKADGTGAWPSVETIAKESLLSEREARYALRNLEILGELNTQLNAGPHGANLYSLPLMAGGGQSLPPSRVLVGGKVCRGQSLPRGAKSDTFAKSYPMDSTVQTKITPPYPPASGGAGVSYQYANPPKPPNRFQFGCQGGIVVEVLVPIGRKLWRNDREAERFRNRIDQVRGAQAETVEEFFRLKGFQVERQKIPLDTGTADNILQHHVAANE